MSYTWMGLVLSSFQYESIKPIDCVAFTCTVEDNLGESKPGRWRLVANLTARQHQDSWSQTKGKAILNVDADTVPWIYGDQLLVDEPLQLMDPPSVPGQFNAQRFFHRQGIDYQVWTRDVSIKVLPEKDESIIRAMAINIRFWMEHQIIRAMPTREDAYMMNALLLGIRRKIDPDLKAAYSAAGVTHILAVSGMHVGLIFWFLQLILGWMKKSRKGQIGFAVLIVSLLWFYALITGLSPSVLRAVMVFSVIQLSDVLRKSPPPINGLCLATIILFIIQPDIIYDVGYQLSFSAVYGIISFHGPLESIWRIKKLNFWKAPHKRAVWEVWNGITISTAATLGTFPVILFYFHQFPTYFLLANLIAVPVSTLLIFGAIGILLASPIPKLAGLVGWLASWFIAFLNWFVVWVSQLPFSLVDEVFLYLPQIALILAGLIFLQLWMRSLRTKALNISLLIFLFCCLSSLVINAWRWKKPPLHFALNAKAGWQMGYIQNRKIVLINLDTSKHSGIANFSFEVKALKEGFHTLSSAMERPQYQAFSFGKKDSTEHSGIGCYNGKTYLILGSYLNFKAKEKVAIDYLIIDKGGTKTLEKALTLFAPKEIWVKMKPEKWKDWQPVLPKNLTIRNFWKEKFQEI